MNPRVKYAMPTDDHKLVLVFENGETRAFDCAGLLDFGVFAELKDIRYFKQARVAYGTVCWPHEQDICPDTLYLDSLPQRAQARGAQEDPAAGVNMIEVVQAEYRGECRVWLKFSDGAAGEVDLADALWGPAFEPLRDPAVFRSFRVSPERGTLVWPNDIDLAPESLRERLGNAVALKVAEPRGEYRVRNARKPLQPQRKMTP